MSGETSQWVTERFGSIEVDPDQIIEFPGLPGFPRARRFVIRQHDRGSVFAWLVSLDIPDLAFVIANPWHLFPDYQPEIPRHPLRALGADQPDDVEIAVLASCGDGEIHCNLMAPLLIHPGTQRGTQVILETDRYSTREAAPAVPTPPEGTAQIESKPQT